MQKINYTYPASTNCLSAYTNYAFPDMDDYKTAVNARMIAPWHGFVGMCDNQATRGWQISDQIAGSTGYQPISVTSEPLAILYATTSVTNTVSGPSIVIKGDGTMWTWGVTLSPSTGRTTGSATTMTQCGVATNWVTAACSSAMGAAINSSGELYTWGTSGNYATGQNTTSSITTPTKVGTDTDWAGVIAIFNGGFAWKTGGGIYSWGLNTNYATAQATNTGSTTIPTAVSSLSAKTVTKVVSGTMSTACTSHALCSDGTLWVTNNTSGGFAQVGVATNWVDVWQDVNLANVWCAKNSLGEIWAMGTTAVWGTGYLGNATTLAVVPSMAADTDITSMHMSTSLVTYVTASGTCKYLGVGSTIGLNNAATPTLLGLVPSNAMVGGGTFARYAWW